MDGFDWGRAKSGIRLNTAYGEVIVKANHSNEEHVRQVINVPGHNDVIYISISGRPAGLTIDEATQIVQELMEQIVYFDGLRKNG